jgi:hypothetical protein
MIYSPGHPWYYLLGGRIRPPGSILQDALDRGYQGYAAADIAATSQQAEPQRSAALRQLKTRFYADYRRDLATYRQLAHQLRQRRKQGLDDRNAPVCAEIHTSISLKYCHLYNDLAHLTFLDDLLSYQRDLFD